MDFQEMLPSEGAWPILAVLLVLLFGGPAILSEKHADKWWAIRSIAKWIKGRRIREIEENSKLAETTMRGHEQDRERWLKQTEELREEIAEDRERFRAEMDAMERKVDAYWSYIVFVADYSRQLAILAAQHGWDPPPPRLLSFSEWSRQYDD